MIQSLFNQLSRRCDKFEHYFPLYEHWFSRFIDKAPKILEIGVQYGGSAELWRSFFGEGTTVHGVDLHPLCEETDYLKLYLGDQGDPRFWKTHFIDRNIADFDLIIDDGSHENPHQIVTLIVTYNLLKNGGIYWCEDTHTSYYRGVRVSDGGYKNPKSFIEFSKNLIDVLHEHHTHYAIGYGPTPGGPHVEPKLMEIFSKMQGIHFYDSAVVIEKGERLPFSRVLHTPEK